MVTLKNFKYLFENGTFLKIVSREKDIYWQEI